MKYGRGYPLSRKCFIRILWKRPAEKTAVSRGVATGADNQKVPSFNDVFTGDDMTRSADGCLGSGFEPKPKREFLIWGVPSVP